MNNMSLIRQVGLLVLGAVLYAAMVWRWPLKPPGL